MPTDIAIIDYGLSNMNSVFSAISKHNLNVKITNKKNEILEAKGCILPGVGNFSEAIKNINQLNLDKIIIEFINSKKPFLGICLGMQLLFTSSEEASTEAGLNIIPGKVLKLKNIDNKSLTNIGWRFVKLKNIKSDFKIYPLKNINEETYLYFVHSFYVKPEDDNIISSTSEFKGIKFCSSVVYENIFACQFHPEKSSFQGLNILESFINNIAVSD